jgi:hypothetical protein
MTGRGRRGSPSAPNGCYATSRLGSASLWGRVGLFALGTKAWHDRTCRTVRVVEEQGRAPFFITPGLRVRVPPLLLSSQSLTGLTSSSFSALAHPWRCPKCGANERYADGRCARCRRAYTVRWREKRGAEQRRALCGPASYTMWGRVREGHLRPPNFEAGAGPSSIAPLPAIEFYRCSTPPTCRRRGEHRCVPARRALARCSLPTTTWLGSGPSRPRRARPRWSGFPAGT